MGAARALQTCNAPCKHPDGDEFDKQLLQNITGNRGEAFRRLRDVHLSEHKDLGADDKIRLLEITNSTKRLLSLLGELRVEAITVAKTGSETL
jgi:hypothetical protein